jgi:ribonuclease E
MTCPRCNGTGVIRDIESSALQVLRVVQEESMKENSAAVYAQVPVDVASYLLNEKRTEIAKLEARVKVDIVLIPNKHLETPHYRLERLKHDDERLANYRASYSLAEGPAEDSWYLNRKTEQPKPRQEAVVKGITPDQPAPVHVPREVEPAPPKSGSHQGQQAPVTSLAGTHASTSGSENQTGIIGRIMGWLRGKAANEAHAPRPAVAAPEPTDERSRAPRNPRDSRETRESREPRDGGRNGREPRDGGARREGRAANDSRRTETAGRTESVSRDPQTAREGTDGRSNRDGRGGRNGRQERPAGEARAPREERPPRNRGSNAEGSAMDIAPVDPATAAQNEVLPRIPAGVVFEAKTDHLHQASSADDALQLASDSEDTTESGEAAERRRRRRRRGGRRDRPEGERTDTESGQSAEGSEQAVTVAQTPTVEAPSAEGLGVQTQNRPARAPRASRTRRPIDSEMPDQESNATASQDAPVEPIASVESISSIEPITLIEPIASTEETAPIAPVESSAAKGNSVAEAHVEPAAIKIVTLEPSTAEAQPLTTEVRPPEPVAQAPQAPVVLTEIVANAGLEWVQTRSDLVVAEGASEAPTQRAPRPARIRKPKVEIVAEPLQMVETKNDSPL